MELAEADPKGLVRESYRIDGITAGECRSIFMDWALSIPVDATVPDAVRVLIATYGAPNPDHPMTTVLHQALTAPEAPRRRGGRTGRQGSVG
ncbi:MAG: hypothetical protein V4720_09485 [Pseudomonadota bacterium]|uniref:hypothetical protein n=1 Tax=Tabrizicola sp. TaxID=2005166 RepID=UPI0025F40074|nr:hypothetical protein [Tabrizicola sp.]